MPECSPIVYTGANETLVAVAEGEEVPGDNRAACCKATKRRSDRVDQEEDFLFVAMEENQPDVANTKETVSPLMRGTRFSMIGLLMTSMVLGLSLGGCYVIFNLGTRYPAPMLTYTFLIALWYFIVYTVVWSLLGRTYQVMASSTRQEAALFVDAVKHHTTFWHWVCTVAAVFCCGIAGLHVIRGEAWAKKIVWGVVWAFVNTAVGWFLVLVAADAVSCL